MYPLMAADCIAVALKVDRHVFVIKSDEPVFDVVVLALVRHC